MRERHRLTDQIAGRYRSGSREQKKRILDEFVATTGYHRKYAIHLLARWGKSQFVHFEGQLLELKAGRRKDPGKRIGRPKYSSQLDAPLARLWVLHNCPSGKRLAAAIRENRQALERSVSLCISGEALDALARMSPATIDRRLAARKRADPLRGLTHTRPQKALRHLVPVRTASDWRDAKCGEFQADTVGHEGGRAVGECCFSLVLVDVASGWTELRALRRRASRWVAQAFEEIYSTLPFPLQALHTDNGGEFINRTLTLKCSERKVRFTRSRADRKNDNCYVECRNDDAVRRSVGYARYDSDAEFEALQEVYRALCPLANFFLPTMRLREKVREGGKLKKRYDAPRTPYRRLLDSPDLSGEAKQRLQELYGSLDLVELKLRYDAALDRLAQLNQAKVAAAQRSPAFSVASSG